MAESRQNLGITTLTLVVVLVSTPATLALSMFMLTGDARWRPLAQTWENALLYVFDNAPLVAVVAWPEDRDIKGGQALGAHIKKSIKSRGIDARISVVATDGQPHVVYRVGRSEIGPYPLSRAVDGIEGAVAAYWQQSGTDELRDPS